MRVSGHATIAEHVTPSLKAKGERLTLEYYYSNSYPIVVHINIHMDTSVLEMKLIKASVPDQSGRGNASMSGSRQESKREV